MLSDEGNETGPPNDCRVVCVTETLFFSCPRQIMNHNSENLKAIYTECSMVLCIN